MSRADGAGRRRGSPRPGGERASPAGDSEDAAAPPVPAEPVCVAALLAAAFVLRLSAVLGTFLTPDEAIFAGIAAAPDLASVYRLTTEQAHPPLYFLLLHLWGRLSGSDLALRLPSVLAATAAVGLLWLFVRRVAGPLPALVAAALLALSPSVVDLTAEVRQYALLLLLETGALVAVTPRDGPPTPARLATTGALLVAAGTTHYSGLLFAAALLVGLSAAFVRRPPGRGAWGALGAATIVVAAVAALLWTSHAAGLRGGALEAEVRTGWLRAFYWEQGESLPGFLFRATAGVFHFVLGSARAGAAAALVAVVALAVRARRDVRPALLLGLPFLAAFAAAALRLHPLGASRHSAWLLPAAAAALSLPFAHLRPATSRRAVSVLAAGAALWAFTAPRSTLSAIPRASRGTDQMDALVAAISRRAEPEEPLFVDTQTYVLLRRYLARTPLPPGPPRDAAELLRKEEIAGRTVWVSRTWLHDDPSFVREIRLLREVSGLEPGHSVRVVNGGSASRLLPQLARAFPTAPVTDPAGFGGSLWTFRIALP